MTSNPIGFGDGWVEIFRAGTYGEKGSFSASDLDRVVANYDPAHHEAPACIGHPKDNLPAYGWASGLKRDGETLLAKFKEVDPAFESAVKAGRFKKRSAAFYLDDAGRIANLRHVAFLGAQPPEVKGLKNLNFEDNGRTFTEVDFGEESQMAAADEKSVKDQIKAFFAELFNPQSPSPKTFSEDDVKRIATEAATTAAAPLQAKITSLETELKDQGVKFTEREKLSVVSETKQRAIAAVNALKAKGRWIPAFEKAGLHLLFEELAGDTATIEFGEVGADGKKPKVAPLDMLVKFMESLPAIIPGGRFVEAAPAQRSQAASGDPLTSAAKARQKEKNITFSEALRQIADEQPELTAVGSSAGGAV